MSSHGSTWNGVPLRVGEMTIGDHLREQGLRVALVGKTHMTADAVGLKRLGINAHSFEGVLAAECGFEPYERDDGLCAERDVMADLRYNQYLRNLGYTGENPWHEYANSSVSDGGDIQSGWLMRHARAPARVKEEHSETAYMTGRAMEFIAEAGDRPWCLHLSYIKPHWPYIAPAPYHSMYGAKDVIAAIGPCIGFDAFEVGPEVVDEFVARFGPAAPVRTRKDGKGHVDLREAVRRQLVDAGVSPDRIDTTDRCTFRDDGEFFSHRRDNGVTGRMAAVIGVK